ncbi:hypothetical protein EB821_04490 [Candidatus Marinimicrobia bacterium PRS2]|nr:hypothetical protein EB821_04490 [Candidatus Marinimicrobia bacterium PRS2]
MTRIIKIITLLFLSFLMMSASCDKGTEGCTDSNACNYDDTAAISDNSCWFVSEGCDCSDLPGSKADCLGVCDPDNENDAPDDDGDGICNEGVIGGCIDTTICNYNQFATHNNDSCAVDLSQFGGNLDGTDCDGACEGNAIMDGCDNPGCIGGVSNSLEPWKIIITAKATFISMVSDTLLEIDSSKVTLGVSKFALDGYNEVEQEGGSTNCADNCYVDIIENPAGFADNSIRFYFPHEDWIDDLDNFNEPNFVQDMRNYDLKVLFSTGIQWDAVIKAINLTYGSIVEEISISFKFKGAIDKCKFIISIDGNLTELLEGEIINYAVNSNEEIQLFINISNICIE